MAGLFKNKVIKQNLQSYNIPNFQEKLEIVIKWLDAYKDGSLAKKTETQCEQAFNNDIFVKVLGYTTFPEKIYTIDPKAETESSAEKPDAALGFFSNERKRVFAVVEIKDVNTSLDKSQKAYGNLSPVQQAFKYKPLYKECAFVISTNFFQIRLYKDNQLDYEVFTLERLADSSDNYFELRKFYYLLNISNFISEKGPSITERLISEIRIEQERITKKFYSQYMKLRIELINNIINNNKKAHEDISGVAIEKAQKIIDRIVFICFCEDLDLLPDNKLYEVIYKADNIGVSLPIWEILKRYFNAIDKGNAGLGIPFGYDGELFKADPILDSLKIDDDICKLFVELGKYDFSEDLSVNILGHIFEQSITDIEELKLLPGSEIIKHLSRRRKEGIYYTPDYIVDYMVRNTLGIYLQDKENEILKESKLIDVTEKRFSKELKKAYLQYLDILRNVTVLDPACGSGAFLVKAFDYLFEENRRITRILSILEEGSIQLSHSEHFIKNLILNNLHGVDINAESVEITKLSLWLKTASKGEKLVGLKNNIKRGNSLIADKNIAGDDAFNWRNEFSEVINNGGFDVIVGNPPYIKEYTDRTAFNGLHNSPYYQGKMDIWTLFACQSIDLLKDNGYFSFIALNNWISAAGASIFRNKVLSDGELLSFVDFGNYKVFKDASNQTMIFVFSKVSPRDIYRIKYCRLQNKNIDLPSLENFLSSNLQMDNKDIISINSVIKPHKLMGHNITFSDQDTEDILENIETNANVFFLAKKEVAQGIVAPQEFVTIDHIPILKHPAKEYDGIFVLSNQEIDRMKLSSEELKHIKPLYTTEELVKYYGNPITKRWIIYAKSDIDEYITMLPSIKKHLDQFREVMTSDNKPYGLHRARDEDFFKGEKIMALRKSSEPTFTYTDYDCYVTQTFFIIKTNKVELKYLTALLNSKLIAFWLRYRGKMQGDNYQIDKGPLLNIPIFNATLEKQNILSKSADIMIELHKKLYDIQSKVSQILVHEYDLKRATKFLERLHLLEFNDFMDGLGVTDIDIKKKDKLFDYFKDYKNAILNIRNDISKHAGFIDQFVFELYGLKPNETELIKNLSLGQDI